jgi:hypothetical protein
MGMKKWDANSTGCIEVFVAIANHQNLLRIPRKFLSLL